MKLQIVFLVMICFISFSCEEKHMGTVNDKCEGGDLELTYLALGDSYTIGEGVQESERWPIQLQTELASADIQLSEVRIIAQTGWTTSNLQSAINEAEIGSYDMVSLLIGVNNQFQGFSFVEFKAEFDLLLEQAIEFSNLNDVFVVSIPDYGVTPFGSANSEEIGEELDMYNAYMAQKSEELNIPFVNITEISRELGAGENALANDNLHPSGYQYSLWVQEILPITVSLLEN